ncbi:MAG: glycerophosphodiester phosphodiesterase [Geminicoccaceae bacterium]|nr:glycerophosphodiester phosphodiesterase [Geminicoccaceae bacterium]
MQDLPPVIGHRGAAAEAPENTLASIRRAHAAGARMVEFDVKLTADDVPILMHDDRLERTTDGHGPVRERTLEEIRRLDAGSWFEPSFAGERVPSLDDALALCLELDLMVNVEIKPCPGREVETARVALDHLRQGWPSSRPAPLISSFEEPSLEAAQDLAPDWPRGYLATTLPRDWRARISRLGCRTVHLGLKHVTSAHAAAVVEAGLPLLIYTVNDVEAARRMFALGASAIFTDRVSGLVGLAQRPQ